TVLGFRRVLSRSCVTPPSRTAAIAGVAAAARRPPRPARPLFLLTGDECIGGLAEYGGGRTRRFLSEGPGWFREPGEGGCDADRGARRPRSAERLRGTDR